MKTPANGESCNINSLNRVYIILLVFSLILSMALFWLFFSSMEPYQLELQSSRTSSKTVTNYVDLDRDGFSESVLVDWDSNNKYYHWYQSYDGGVFDQGNFTHTPEKEWFYFGDYTGDNYSEIIIYTLSSDSLYISIFNQNLNQWILKEQLLYSNPSTESGWDVQIRGSLLHDTDQDGKKELVYLLSAGHSIYPRGVYVFDIEDRTYLSRFESAAYMMQMFLFDLTGDGEKEIIAISRSPRNTDNSARYGDHNCWLFVFNQELNLLFPPMSFGEFPSDVHGYPFNKNGEPKLLLIYAYSGTKSLPSYLYLMNSKGEIENQLPIMSRIGLWPVIQRDEDNLEIILPLNVDNSLVTYNQDFKEVRRIVNINELERLRGADVDGKKGQELLVLSGDKLKILNHKLEPIASYPRNDLDDLWKIYFRYKGMGNPPDIFINGRETHYHFKLKPSPWHQWRMVILPLQTVVIFGGLAGLHKLAAIFFIYLGALFNALQKSSSGMLIVDHKGKVMHYNQSLLEQGLIESAPKKGVHYQVLFAAYPQIISLIERALANGQQANEEVSINDGVIHFEGEISAMPFLAPLQLVYGTLITFKDYTRAVQSEQIIIWSRTMQLLAHEIRGPLGIIRANLKMMQQHFKKQTVPAMPELNEMLEMMYEELAGIREKTLNLLKFADLENPNPRIVELETIVHKSLKVFMLLPKNELQITIDIRPEANRVWADPRQLNLVIRFLVKNAIDAMKGRGRVEISACLIDNLAAPAHIEVEIRDTGPGIPDDIREKIFEPNFSTKVDGAGMGMALVKKMVEDNNGKIDIRYTKPGMGTTICFTLLAANAKTVDNNIAFLRRKKNDPQNFGRR